jgi:hypothetical protein
MTPFGPGRGSRIRTPLEHPHPARRARIRSILGQPGARLRIHDHAVPDIAARHPLHKPLRTGHPRLGAPR